MVVTEKNSGEKRSLDGLERADFFLQAAEIANTRILQHPLYLWLALRSPEIETITYDAVINHQFGRVTDESQFMDLLGLSHKKQNIWRTLALERLEKGENLGFSEEEAAVLMGGIRIANVMDGVYMHYRKEMIGSPLEKRLSAMPEGEAPQWAMEQGISNGYTVYREENGEISEIPYAVVFRYEYEKLDHALDTLLRKLEGLPKHSQPFILYFEAYRSALMETDPAKLEEKWRQVDLLWMNIKGPLQPIHAMEHYMDPTRTRIDPDFRIVIDDPRAKAVTNQALVTQDRLIRDMSETFGTYDSFNASMYAMRNSKALVGTTIVMSGFVLNFRPAGQNVPNRSEVRAEKGAKIFMDLLTLDIRSKEMRGLLEAVFGKEFADSHYRDPDYKIAGGILTAGHEVNHNAFITSQTDKKLGNHALVEETKADLGVFTTLSHQLEKGEISMDDVQRILTVNIGKSLRNFKIREIQALRPYYLLSVIEFNLMKEAGIIRKDGSNWNCSFSSEAVRRFFEMANKALGDLAEAYDTHSQNGIKKFIDKYFVETPEILELSDKIAKI